MDGRTDSKIEGAGAAVLPHLRTELGQAMGWNGTEACRKRIIGGRIRERVAVDGRSGRQGRELSSPAQMRRPVVRWWAGGLEATTTTATAAEATRRRMDGGGGQLPKRLEWSEDAPGRRRLDPRPGMAVTRNSPHHAPRAPPPPRASRHPPT